MRTRVAHLLNRSVRYLEVGGDDADAAASRPVRPGALPIVWLHAFPLSADQWLPQLARGSAGRRAIAPDLRGFRGSGPDVSDVGLDDIRIDDYAADVLELMTHLGIERAAVGGVSMGGYVAFGMLRQAPDRIGALLLANTRATADSADARAARDRTIDLVRREGVGALAREMTPKLLGETTRRERPDLAEAVAHLIEMNTADGLVAALGALRDRPDSTPLLSSIRCPATVVAGEEDAIIPLAEHEALARAIPDARLVVLPGVGHLSNVEGDGSVFHNFGR
jgi:pimeloyl-ACP methyl ester carboxylesterase